MGSQKAKELQAVVLICRHIAGMCDGKERLAGGLVQGLSYAVCCSSFIRRSFWKKNDPAAVKLINGAVLKYRT